MNHKESATLANRSSGHNSMRITRKRMWGDWHLPSKRKTKECENCTTWTQKLPMSVASRRPLSEVAPRLPVIKNGSNDLPKVAPPLETGIGRKGGRHLDFALPPGGVKRTPLLGCGPSTKPQTLFPLRPALLARGPLQRCLESRQECHQEILLKRRSPRIDGGNHCNHQKQRRVHT